jgi:hypothetical protein
MIVYSSKPFYRSFPTYFEQVQEITGRLMRGEEKKVEEVSLTDTAVLEGGVIET